MKSKAYEHSLTDTLSSYFRVGQGTTVLPTTAVQELSGRATLILNIVQRFFASHLIDNYGCDYSSSGLTADAAAAKLCAFFQRQTADGPKYDTYVVYYSGHVHENGDWALAGKDKDNTYMCDVVWFCVC